MQVERRKGLSVVPFVILIVLVFLGLSFMFTYNSIISLEEDVDESRANVNVDLQRRYDLIPNLVNIVKGYAEHEQEIYDKLLNARASLAGNPMDSGNAEIRQELEQGLGRLLALSEDNPELKANEQFIALMDQLEGTENRLATSRRRYNEAAVEYNKKIRRFPANIVAGFMGAERVETIQENPEHQNAPEVNF